MEYSLFLLMCFMCVFSTNPDFKRAKQCYVSVGYNIDYQGNRNVSNTNSACVDWKATTWASSDFDGTMDNNFCRNPDKDLKGPWCIIKSGRRESCTIPKCASSAMFDGTGNIDHQFYMNSTTSDNISLAFYTNEQWQNKATIIAIKSWGVGLMELKLMSNRNSGIKDMLKLQWQFDYDKESMQMHSRANQANGELVRVNVIRTGRNVKMFVNGLESFGSVSKQISSDAVFKNPGNIFIGKSPYGTSGFKGCIADLSYNNIRPLDMAMGSRPKTENEVITISRGVWEGCLLIPPSDWVTPPPVPSSNEVEIGNSVVPETEYVISNGTQIEQNGSSHAARLSGIIITIFLILQFG